MDIAFEEREEFAEEPETETKGEIAKDSAKAQGDSFVSLPMLLLRKVVVVVWVVLLLLLADLLLLIVEFVGFECL